MPSFSIPLSGLDSSQKALAVVANNLANMNTVGYKDQDVNFRDLFYQTMSINGSGEALQVGSGTSVSSISSNFTNGSVSSTGIPTDVAINGDGFFITQVNGQTQYTRAGNFVEDQKGMLLTQDGQYVMGYTVANGVVSTGAVAPLNVGQGMIAPASATTTIQMALNLNSATAQAGDYSTQLAVVDSLGTSHILTLNFTKTANNAWNYTVSAPDSDLSVNPATGQPVIPTVPPSQLQIASGTMGFNSSGELTTVNGITLRPVGGPNVSSIPGISLNSLSDGASNMSVAWNVLDSQSNPVITQTSMASGVASSTQNGYPSGSLSSFSVATDGKLEGLFSNGQVQVLGQIALAKFGNADGLQRSGSNSYVATLASGAAVVGTSGTGGLGALTGGALEQSNVDMAKEFSNMIIFQRAFQANAKVVTAFDQVTQDTINMQR